MNPFQDSLETYTKQNDGLQANRLLMYELGKILVKHKSDFVELLNQSGIYASNEMSDIELINKFVDSINYNRKLLIGTAFVINHHNKSIGFDGREEICDDSVKGAYKTMYSYFGAYDFMDSNEDSDFYNASGDPVSAVAQGIGQIAGLGTKIADNQGKKKYGALDLATKKQDAKNQIIQGAVLQKQTDAKAKEEATAKKKKIIKIVAWSVGGVVAVVGVIALVMYIKKK